MTSTFLPTTDSSEIVLIDQAQRGDEGAFRRLAETYSRELHLHCYRMLGSLHDAEDLVQETLLRAWRRLDSYQGRASFRAWLYKIATNACLDALARRPRRVVPADYAPAADPALPLPPPVTEPIWLEPYPDALPELAGDGADEPEVRVVAREGISLAFLAAIQYLPPRQRAVLILRDVLDWPAAEVAELLDASVASVNSALQRARAALRQRFPDGRDDAVVDPAADDMERRLLDRYLQAWESRDVHALAALLAEDVTLTMPPVPSWYRGRDAIVRCISMVILADDAYRHLHRVPTRANGRPAFAVYAWDARDGVFRALGLEVLTTIEDGLIARWDAFTDTTLFPLFGLPMMREETTAEIASGRR